jgi:hypothetical protein
MDYITVKKNSSSASGKTRKLINKNGPIYELLKLGYQHSGERQYQILVRSISTGWQGWLPLLEITYEQYNGPLTRESFR